jgi:hypothetical protein
MKKTIAALVLATTALLSTACEPHYDDHPYTTHRTVVHHYYPPRRVVVHHTVVHHVVVHHRY